MKRWLGCLLAVALVAGCGDDGNNEETALSVAGSWCGIDVATAEECLGDEVGFLQLTQSGSSVTGQLCEAYNKDCYAIQDGKLSNGKLTFYYTFGDAGADRCDADLSLSGTTLTGSLFCTKCNCDIPTTLHLL